MVVPAGAFAASNGAVPGTHDKPELRFYKARIFTDGYITPDQVETVGITNMPPKAEVEVAIEPPPITPQCGQFFFCDFAFPAPAPGSPPWRTDSKGQATISFVTPTGYTISTDPFKPSTKQFVTFANQQRVHIDAQAVKRTKKTRRIGFGFGRMIVQLP